MEKLIKMLFKACFVLWLLIAMLSWIILACVGEISHITEKQGAIIALVATLWIIVPPILFLATGTAERITKYLERKGDKLKA